MIEKCSPEDYKAIFEDHKTGAKILDELIARFGVLPSNSNGIDRVLNQFEYSGQRKVIEFIALRINQANGIKSHGETIDTTHNEV